MGIDAKTFFEHYFLTMCIRFDSCNNNSLAFAAYLSLPNFFIIIQSIHHPVYLHNITADSIQAGLIVFPPQKKIIDIYVERRLIAHENYSN